MNKIRWGIMGTGRIAGVFCDMLQKLEDASIYAVASRTEEKSAEFGNKYKAAVCYGSYEALAADPDVDIIYVATPIACHYDNVKLCLTSGKNVLCEKAFVQDTARAKELYALAKDHGLFLMEGMWSKCQPVFRKLMEWKESGKFGDIMAIDARFYTMGGRNHRLVKYPEQGGVLLDLMIYPLTYACALLGYHPADIRTAGMIGPAGVDIMDSVQLQYNNGSYAALTAGVSHERQISLYIQGTEGKVLINQEFFFQAQKAVLTDWDNQPVEEFDGTFLFSGYEYEAIEAMECLRAGRTESSLVPMEETIAILELLEKCKSQLPTHHTGRNSNE